MTRCVALLRGINVGRAKRIVMADLRALVEELGFAEVRTLLNSGNVIFEAPKPECGKIAAALEAAIQRSFGHSVPVVVHTARELGTIIRQNPLPQAAVEPSRFLVAFIAERTTLTKARQLLAQEWAPDALAVGSKAAYLWCANGIIESKLLQAFSRLTANAATARNWATVLKLHAAAGAVQDAA